MKKLNFYSLFIALFFTQCVNAQCIKDIQSLINMPAPCFFVGNIDFDNTECFDVFVFPSWTYTWKIKNAHTGELVATYNGIAFQHTFTKFGGYVFCLEVDKDDDPTNAPDIVDCVTYTTCEVCTSDSIKIEYITCPFGEGCEISLSAKIHAANDIGLKPSAKFFVTYLPTPQELLGGIESYEIEFDDIDIEFNPYTDSISVFQNVTVPFKRGCFKPRIEFKLLDGYGAHASDGMSCTEIELRSEEKFRCIACANQDGRCIASEVASQISNEEDSCDPFYFCNQLREAEIDDIEAGAKINLVANPNPANDRLHFEFPPSGSDFRQLLFFNNIGQQMMLLDIPSGDRAADLMVGSLNPGLYFANLMEDGRLVQSTQVVIRR
jgi:hypothetical protein